MGHREFLMIEDFVFDPSFRNWVLHNSQEDRFYWEQWMQLHPDKANVLNYARAIVYALSVNHQQLSDKELKEEIQDIIQKARQSAAEETDSKNSFKFYTQKPVIKRLNIWWANAAAVLLIALLSIFYFYKKEAPQKEEIAYYELPSSHKSSSAIEQVNNSDTIQTIALSDGSKVRLYPKSKLSFSQTSATKKREVYLIGEAFFDVKKNPAQPFFVYTKSMVTKVLGTSFNVKAYAADKKAMVLVRTGKVSVYKKENFSEKNTVANKLDGLIVTPNQQVIYDLVSNQLSKTIIDKPVVLNTGEEGQFVFNATPLKEVFRVLQNTYGITIMYDESVISSCSLSVTMGNESFYEKLEMICKAIGASYESIDGTIFISAHGCN